MTAKDNFLGFRSHPHPESPDGMLAEYLGARGSKKDAMLQAIRSYWLPLALEDTGVRGRALEKVGYEAVLDLLKQARYICVVLGLDPNQLGLGSGMVVSPPPESSASSTSSSTESSQESSSADSLKEQLDNYKWEDLGFDKWPEN